MPRLARRRQTGANYPTDVSTLLNPPMRLRVDVQAALRAFKARRPYRGTILERCAKFNALHSALCDIYNMRTQLDLNIRGQESRSGNGYYYPDSDKIALTGKLSIVTYLHEFAHAINGEDEEFAVRWSLSYFKRIWPRLFANLNIGDGRAAHVVTPRTLEKARREPYQLIRRAYIRTHD